MGVNSGARIRKDLPPCTRCKAPLYIYVAAHEADAPTPATRIRVCSFCAAKAHAKAASKKGFAS